MTGHITQTQRITEVLERDGQISRNQCLSMSPAIGRLACRIVDLEHAGWKFRAEACGNDYFYVVTARPKPRQLSLV